MATFYKLVFSFVLLLLFALPGAFSQSNDFKQSVPAWVSFPGDDGTVQLNWIPVNSATGYAIYRKTKNSNSWGLARANLDGSDSTWTDDSVQPGRAYEYRIRRTAGGYGGEGYVLAGSEIPAEALPGELLLLVDNRFGLSLAPEIDRYVRDLVREGWSVETRFISKDTTVTYVKGLIEDAYADAPGQMRAVFMLGHVPVPYSGEIAPDGHSNHVGAWAADGYYGDVNGFWTDFSVNNTTASRPANQNVPGDGKFDQSSFPSAIELEVGRVDFYDMPAFSESEEELLRRYLNKNHAFRQGRIVTQRRALIENNFSSFAEGFGQNGLKNFTPMFGPDDVEYLDYRLTLQGGSYLCSYGCGAGSYTSCGGVTNTNNFAQDSLQTIFTMLFGSYFGDWDSQNNLLRASIASGLTLTNFWAGRPNYTMHQMALGETVGYSVKRSMNNSSTYLTGFGPTGVHMALMGDPTLRLFPHPPMDQLMADATSDHAMLSWEEADSNALGYMLFRLDEGDNTFSPLTNEMIEQTSYVDSCLETGRYRYMVRAVYLDSTASGTYYSLGPGAIDTTRVDVVVLPEADFNANVSNDTLFIRNNSVNATAFFWDFGDGNTSTDSFPTHIYEESGDYIVELIAWNDCYSDTLSIQVTIDISTTVPAFAIDQIRVRPNPVYDMLHIDIPVALSDMELQIQNLSGQVLLYQHDASGLTTIPVSNWTPGMYVLRIWNAKHSVSRKFIIKH